MQQFRRRFRDLPGGRVAWRADAHTQPAIQIVLMEAARVVVTGKHARAPYGGLRMTTRSTIPEEVRNIVRRAVQIIDLAISEISDSCPLR